MLQPECQTWHQMQAGITAALLLRDGNANRLWAESENQTPNLGRVNKRRPIMDKPELPAGEGGGLVLSGGVLSIDSG